MAGRGGHHHGRRCVTVRILVSWRGLATETLIFFDSVLTAADLPDVPARIVGECPNFVTYFHQWGWRVDPGLYEWSSYPDVTRPIDLRWVPDLWASGRDVQLFGPGGFIHFGPRWMYWSSETKWSWFTDTTSPISRDEFLAAATQLAALCRSRVGFITPAGGSEDNLLDLVEAGANVTEALDELARRPDPPVPLTAIDFANRAPCAYQFIVRYP